MVTGKKCERRPPGWRMILKWRFLFIRYNIFTWRPATSFDISKKVSSEFSVASMLPCGIWKMQYGLREFTQHHHEVAQMMNFHIVGAQSPTRSSGLGRDRSDVRSKNTASLVSNTELLLWCKPLIQMPLWPIFLVYDVKTPSYVWLRWPHFSPLRSETGKRWCLPPRLRAAVIFPTARLLKDEKMTKQITIKGVSNKRWR